MGDPVGAGGLVAALPLGFVIGLALGGLGGGGSILAVPALVYGVGESAHAATTTSLVAVGATALVGMMGYVRAGRVRVVAGLIVGLVGLGGSLLGSLMSRSIPDNVLLLAFSVLILLAAWRMHTRHTETPCSAKQLAAVGARQDSATGVEGAALTATDKAVRHSAAAGKVVIAGSIVGFLTGFFGVGGGFVIVPALVLALGYEMPVAVGTSLLVIAISSAESLLFRLSSEEIDWRVAIPFTAAGLVGVLVGGMTATRVPAERLTRWFVWLLVAVAGYTAVQSVMSM
ncbi:MAG: sulfite exporter TauE/SafE family protein [Mycobacterium sp.]|nr:MAG: sulfite exporter TauE/SafE family protein [Mycobacterium sp.]